MYYECLISILQYLMDSSNSSDLGTLSTSIDIVDIILHDCPHNAVALSAKQCLIEKLNNTLEEMNREENHCHD